MVKHTRSDWSIMSNLWWTHVSAELILDPGDDHLWVTWDQE
jgi:hypothetical protein